MNTSIDIQKNERGAIRVFAVNLSPAEVTETLQTLPKADVARQLLGNPHLNTASAEIFPVSDLTGMGLSSYLSEGYAVEEAEIGADKSKLDALEGYVLLLFSDSFRGVEMTLTPGAELTLIGTYAEYTPSGAAPPITTDSARPYSGTPGMTPPTPPRGPAGSALVVIALAVLLGLGLWWLFT
ncbi:hypothetical protein [uncultured Roseobacter sp.]|uniref:hypothetical protein n=1 Tax=uncultured Roseobacter sp. TaxID=114847 RepID=UPI002621E01B|nr:hypothetical protein [uncultured Roseobacter sp.]